MGQIHSTAACNAATNAVTALLGSGAKLKFRTAGTIGAPGTAAATLSFSATPFASAAAGMATANTITGDSSATGNASAVATATMETSGGTIVVHCSVAAIGGDINLSGGLTIAAGDVVTCSGLRYAALVDRTDSMLVGVNVAKQFYFGGQAIFANLMHGGAGWQDSGAAYAEWHPQPLGVITGATSANINVLALAESPTSLPAGTYTVRNPGGFELAFGSRSGGPDLATSVSAAGVYTTATSFTITLAANSGFDVWCKGNTPTTSGKLEIILPGHTTSYDAGDYFNSAWVSFQQGLGVKAIRTMDWCGTNNNIIADWADRTTMTGHTFYNRMSENGYPYEIAIAAANRLNVDLYVCVPHRATDAFVTSLASLVSSTYTGRKAVFVEYANETPNEGNVVFSAQKYWVQHLTFTKVVTTISGSTFTRTAHGYANDKLLRGFEHPQTRSLAIDSSTPWWLLTMGVARYVKVLSANTFELWDGAGGTGNLITAPTGTTQAYLIDPAEVGKTADLNENHGTRSKEIWDIFDTALGSSRVKAVMGSWAVDVSATTARMNASSGAAGARANYVNIAPYFYGNTFGGAIDRASTQFTPKVYSTDTATAYVRVYANGSTPRVDEIKAGTGTGYVGGSSFAANTSTTYTSGSAITGLTNTSVYLVCFVIVDSAGYTWSWSQNVTASASSDTVDVLDTYDNQKLRALYDIDQGEGSAYSKIVAHKAAAQAINSATEVLCYEGWSHQDETKPTAINTWFEGWLEDPTFAEVGRHFLNEVSGGGCKHFFIYQDMNLTGPWTLADNTYDTTDLRYLGVAAYAGYVPKRPMLSISTIDGGTITAAPGAYPSTQYTFSDTTLAYQIVSGDDAANFRIRGAVLQQIASNGINYAVTDTKLLKIRATDALSECFFTVSVVTGPANWYEADANFAWSKFEDTDAAVMNPIISLNTLPENSGSSTPSTIDGSGWWDLNNVSAYGNPNAMLNTITYNTTVWGLLYVAKRGSSAAGGNIAMVGFNTTDFVGFKTSSDGSSLIWEWYDAAAVEIQDTESWSDGNPVVAWHLFDGPNNKYYRGKNQTYLTGYSSGIALPATRHTTIDKSVQFDISHVKHGALEVVSRVGMTPTDWLAIVQKVQTKFGI